ncbi:MAG: MATE family efflux transporter [Candidatus Obscuribacterales bacterium]|nr:MATE family efflux transporter [Candidatus Obscuribacterales bacterium]
MSGSSISEPETFQEEVKLSPEDELITKGSLYKAIWQLSWPLYINMMTIALTGFSEVWVGGQLGSSAQAAIGLGGQIWFFTVILVVALSSGTNALVSRFWGAGDRGQAIVAARQSLFFSVLFGLFVMTCGLLWCRPLLRALGASPEVEALGWEFLKYDMLGQPLITIHWVSNSIFRARGDTRTPMITMALVVAMVIALNMTLCIYPFHYGITGLGLSWPIASCFGVALSLYLLRRGPLGSCMDLRGPGLSYEWLVRLMKIGIPACIQDLAWVGGNMVLLLILAKTANPTAGEAAWSIGLRLEEMLGGLPMCALGTAVGTIVGQNLGAKNPDRAELAGWKVAGIAALYNCLVGCVLFFGASTIAGIMSRDPLVIKYSIEYMQVVGLSQPFVAVWIALVGAMHGAGYTKEPMIFTVLLLVGFRLPFAWYLTVNQNLGPLGTWISLAVSSFFVGLAMCWLFKSKRWQLQKV